MPRSSRSRLERSAFCISTRWRASTINRLILARRLYQVLRSTAKFAFPGTRLQVDPPEQYSRTILDCDLSIVGKPHYLIPGRYRRGSPLLPRITTSPSVIGRLATIRLQLRRLAPQQSETTSHFGKILGIDEYFPLGFLPKVFVHAGGL